MLNEILKNKFQPLVPLAFFRFLGKAKITPNVLTTIAIIFGIIAFYFFYQGRIFLAAVFVLLNYLFDILDGMEARTLGLQTKAGGFYDFVTDRAVRFSWYLALIKSHTLESYLVFLVVTLEALGNIIFLYVSAKNLRYLNFMPYALPLLPIGAILNSIPQALTLELYLGSGILMINFVSILYLNFSENRAKLD